MSTPKHLIHIGFPKAGSTFLQEWFRKHPKFHFRNAGFGGYHNLYEFIRDATRLEINQYAYLVTSSESIAVASTYAGIKNQNFGLNNYTFDSKGAESNLSDALYSLYPNSKILIITRGFKSVLKSGYAQYISQGGVQSMTQMKSNSKGELRQIADQLGIENIDLVIHLILNGKIYTDYQIDKHPRAAKMIEIFYKKYSSYFYDDVIKLYQRKFGENNVIVMPYELLKANQKVFLEELQQQLHLSPIDIDIGIMNPSLSKQDLYWYRKLSRVVARIARMTGKKGYRIIFGNYMTQLRNNRFQALLKLLKRAFPKKIIEPYEVSEADLIWYKTKADSLKNNPLYQQYGKEYLWD